MYLSPFIIIIFCTLELPFLTFYINYYLISSLQCFEDGCWLIPEVVI